MLFSWMSLVDVVRAEFLRGRNLEYVRAAKALGLPDRHHVPAHPAQRHGRHVTFLPFISAAPSPP